MATTVWAAVSPGRRKLTQAPQLASAVPVQLADGLSPPLWAPQLASAVPEQLAVGPGAPPCQVPLATKGVENRATKYRV